MPQSYVILLYKIENEKRRERKTAFPDLTDRGAETVDGFQIQEGEWFMTATGSKKSSAARRRTSGGKQGRKTSGKSGTSAKKRQTRKKADNGVRQEVLVLVMLAVSILLFISNFGIGGVIGTAVSRFFFGVFGWMAYLFPAALFFGTAFAAANRKNPAAVWKMCGLLLLFLCICGLVHLITLGYVAGDSISGYYTVCARRKTGGGILGGGIAKILCTAFGTLGAYVVLVILLVIAAIIMTQKPLLAPLKSRGEKVYQEAKENRIRRRASEVKISFDQTDMKHAGTLEDVPDEEKTKGRRSRRKAERENNKGMKPSEEMEAPADFTIQRPSQEELFGQFPDPDNGMTELSGSDGAAQAQETQQRTPPSQEQETEKTSRERKKNPRSSQKEIADGIQNIQQEISGTKEKAKVYEFPPLTLLKRGDKRASGDSDQHLRNTARKLQETLHSFGVNVTVTNVSCGPTVTRYELQPEQGVKVSRIVGLADDIKLNLAAADIRIEAPIPGKAAVGIEVPNATNSPVMLRDLLETREFQEFPSDLAFAVGKDIGGKPVVSDIGKMPHLLIAGATGSGKSVCINTLVMSILYKASPEDVKLIMIDPKVVELSVYNGIPHLFIPVVTEPKKAAGALNWAVAEMTDRYNKFAQYNVRDLKGYNEKVEALKDIDDPEKPAKLPKIVIIVDELADLMMVAPGEVEDAICRLAQLARAAGIHLIIATQRPSVNVITGLIKANMPSRIAFSVSSGVDSRTILDMNGAEKLLGKGDMLYYPQGYQKPARLQGSFVSDAEVGAVVNFLTENHQADKTYDEKITEMMNAGPAAQSGGAASEKDAYFVEAGKFIIEKDKASIGMLQRMFKIGFNRAARIMDQLSEAGVVGPEEGTKPRKILMSAEEFEKYIEESL